MSVKEWQTTNYLESRLDRNFKERYKTIRSNASNFIKRGDVRKFVFDLDNNKCTKCGATENLTIDHIISVYRAAKFEITLKELNSFVNLRTLCRKCNSGLNPESDLF
jgi:5-methylcytosine-specific restriction endonuclease McrA